MSSHIATEAQERTVRSFTVYGTPVGKGRPRFRNTGKFVQTYTPEKTANYETLVKLAYQQEYGGEPLLAGAISAKIIAYFPIPKSTSRKAKKEMLNGWHVKKCDADNLIKSILDALNEVAYRDDSAVAKIYCEKRYSEMPRVEISLDIIPME